MSNIEKNILKISNSSFSSNLINELCLLAEEQWHTYEILNDDTKKNISKWIIQNLDEFLSDIDKTEKLSFLIGTLGLGEVFHHMKVIQNNNILDEDIVDEIKEMIKEFEGNIDNPYSGMF